MLGLRASLKYAIGGGVPAFVAAKSAVTGDGPSFHDLILPYPAGWAAGDVIFAIVIDQFGTGGGYSGPAFPTGWTPLRADTDSSGAGMYIRTRILASGDTPSITIPEFISPLDGNRVYLVGITMLYRNPQTPLVNTSAFAKDAVHSLDEQNNAPGVTPGRSGIAFSVFMKRTGLDNIATPPPGMTLRAFRASVAESGPITKAPIITGDGGNANDHTVAVYDMPVVAGAATGTKTLTWNHGANFYENDARYGQTVVL